MSGWNAKNAKAVEMDADLGFAFVSQPSLSQQLECALRLEELGYKSVWVAESRMLREAFTSLGALAVTTNRIRLGALVNSYTRNPALMAMSVATLAEVAENRIDLVLTSYWTEIARKQGIDRGHTVDHLRTYVTSLRALLGMQRVSVDTPTIKLRDVALDLGQSGDWMPLEVSISLLLTDEQVAELATDLNVGVVLNGLTSPTVTADMLSTARTFGGARAQVVGPLINIALDDDPDVALHKAKRFLAAYLGQQPHFGILNGLDPELLDRLRSYVGLWPSTENDVESGAQLISRDLVTSMMIAGTASDCMAGILRWLEAGVDYPIIVPVHGDPIAIASQFRSARA